MHGDGSEAVFSPKIAGYLLIKYISSSLLLFISLKPTSTIYLITVT